MTKRSSGIRKRQNEKEMQQLLVTQHYTYKHAKHLLAILFVISVLVPSSINIALYFNLNDIYMGILAAISIFLLFLVNYISILIDNIKKKAAMIQQKFDLYVFNLDIETIIDDNIVAEQIEKYIKKDWDRKVNWYADYDSLDVEKAVFYSQKENIDWTDNIAKRYRNFLICIAFIALFAFIINLVLNNSSVTKMLSIVLAALPLVSYAKTAYLKIKVDDANLNEIKRIADNINNSIDILSSENLKNKIGILQISMYKLRQEKYLVPDWFENKYHKKNQAIENRKARQRTHKRKNQIK